MKNEIKAKVMTIANELFYRGSKSRSEALRTAWEITKKNTIYTKVRGVSFGKRQQALEHLKRYSKETILIHLQRELNNEYDKNAVAIIVEVIGKGQYQIGYLKKEYAQIIAPLLDKNLIINSKIESITGGQEYKRYGANIRLNLAA